MVNSQLARHAVLTVLKQTALCPLQQEHESADLQKLLSNCWEEHSDLQNVKHIIKKTNASPKEQKATECWRKYILKSFIICSLLLTLLRHSYEGDDVYGMHYALDLKKYISPASLYVTAGNCQRALADETGMIRNHMGMCNR
jgi:hypothetical protein